MLTGVVSDIAVAYILQKSLHISGIYVGSREMFVSMNRAITQHQLRPIIDRVFPMVEIQAALEYMQSAKHFGKIVIQLV